MHDNQDQVVMRRRSSCTTTSSASSSMSPILEDPSQTSAAITKREDLVFLKPRVEFVSRNEAREDGISVPASVEGLWQTYEETHAAGLSANPFHPRR